MNLSKDNIKKMCGIILFTIVAFLSIQNLDKVIAGLQFVWGILFPFVLGGIFAFILNIPMRSIEKLILKLSKKKKKRTKAVVRSLSLLITLFLVMGVISAVMFIVIPQIGDTVRELTRAAEAFFPKVQVWAEDMFKNNKQIYDWISGIQINMDRIIETAFNFLQNGAGDVIGSTFSATKAVVSGIMAFFVGIIFACYLLVTKETLQRQLTMLMNAALPEKAVEKILHIAKLSSNTFSSFFTGQCLEALILGSMFFVVMTIMRMPYSLLISILIAFASLIPIFGAFIGCIVGAFLIVMVSPLQALIFIITFLVIQQIEGNLIYPKVVGTSVGLPSMWVLFAVTVGSSLMGVAGMLFFIPFTSVLYSLIREWTYGRLEKQGKQKA